LAAILAILLLLLLVLLATCRNRGHPAPVAAAREAAQAPSPTSEAPVLRPGLELVAEDHATGLITIRDQATGDVVELKLADFTPERVEQALALKAASRGNAAPAKSRPTPSPAGAAGTPTAAAVPASGPPPAGQGGPEARDSGGVPAAPSATGLPSFVPAYPGATTVTLSATTDQGSAHGAYVFVTPDAPDVTGRFYADKATAGGLVVIVNVAASDKSGATYTLIAQDAATNRSLSFTAGIEQGRTRGSIEFVGK
jgi:hypothetical protein